jgi:Mg2+-importing ATPase
MCFGSVSHDVNNDIIFITKGAPESVLLRCKNAESTESTEAIVTVLDSIKTKLSTLSESGYRTIAVAYKPVQNKISYSIEDERNLTLSGILVFTDPPKKDPRHQYPRLLHK